MTIKKYFLNSLKVLIIGLLWLFLYAVPWETLSIGGMLIVAMISWVVWDIMVLMVSGESGNYKRNHETRSHNTVDDKDMI